MSYYLGVDIGGTNLALGVVNEKNEIVARSHAKCPTPCSEEHFCEIVAAAVHEALDNAGITLKDIPWIGVGCPGTVNRDSGTIEFANNLGFANFPLRDMLGKLLDGKNIIIENDANAAAYGEFKAGSLKGAKNAVAITLGTGIGSGIIIDGKIYAGTNYAAGEMGHTVIVHNGRQCNCGRKGCWECYASATALIRSTKEAMEANKDSKLWAIADNNLENVNGRTPFEGAKLGDETAKKVLDEYIDYLGCGLANTVNIFQPDIMCIGGGVSNAGDALLKPVAAYVDHAQYTMNTKIKTKICRASLGNDAGIIGAALLGM